MPLVLCILVLLAIFFPGVIRALYFVLMLAVLCVAGLAIQGASASGLPPVVQAAYDEAAKTCAPDKTDIQKGFITTKDVNGDGIPDYILDYGKVTCGHSGSLKCGSDGCLTQIYASMPDGRFAKVFDDNVQAMKFSTSGGRPVIRIGLHGSACGKAGYQPCGETLFWNGARFSPAH